MNEYNLKPQNSLDDIVTLKLAGSFRSYSRRSFLSFVTKKVIAVTGIAVLAPALPYFVPTVLAEGDGPECGRHGYFCTGNCSNAGASVGASWVQCCKVPCPPPSTASQYQCCTYTDYMGTRSANWPSGCAPAASGGVWSGGVPGEYICTATNCTGNYSTPDACQTGCMPAPLSGTC